MQPQPSDYDYVFKVVLVGNSGVGKTSLLRRLVDRDFDDSNSRSTIGVEFKILSLDLPSKKVAKIQVWDTAGQERYRAITAAYYRGMKAIAVVFDLTNRKSFDDLSSWMEEVSQHFPQFNTKIIDSEDDDESDIVGYLFGNKKDLETKICVGKEEALDFARKYGMQYKEVSAKLGSGVHDSFNQIAVMCEKKLLARVKIDAEKQKAQIAQSETIDFFEQPPVVQKEQCSC